MTDKPSEQLEAWEQEVLARHRWGQHGDQAQRELVRLRALWARCRPLDGNTRAVLDQIQALEICNWDLGEAIVALCRAIGAKRPAERGIGHARSITEERWTRVWATYAALRTWLVPDEGTGGYRTLQNLSDPGGKIARHVQALLGARTKLKELYAERLCLLLEFTLRRGGFPADSVQLRAHAAATSAVEAEIQAHDPDRALLQALSFTLYEGYACYPGLEPCHHKFFRRLDIIISSIGAGRWRGIMPRRGTDGFERADLLEAYLAPIEAWLGGASVPAGGEGPADRILPSLGEPDDVRRFLASLLVSLLRAQQIAARNRAERRLRAGGVTDGL